MAERLRVVVLGYLVRGPLGGLAWHHLQYVAGLDRLGHDVHFLEESGEHRDCCYDPARGVNGPDPTYGLAFVARAFERLGLADRWAYRDEHTRRWLGPAAGRVAEITSSADLVLNLSAVNRLLPELEAIPARAIVDTDPVFTQVRNLTEDDRSASASSHTAYFSFGHNVGSEASPLPDDGFPWRPTRQPVVLDLWPVTPGPREGRFRTVMQWESYYPRELAGMRYGMKSQSFLDYLDLPSATGRPFELAVGNPAPMDLLGEKGWVVSDPLEATRDPWTYQRFVQQSKAEFSVAKHGYVATRSGWFSERSAGFLASGRPVALQDTGYSRWLPTGTGLLSFTDFDSAVEAIQEVDRDYERHSTAARALAEEHFDSGRVLSALIEEALAPDRGLKTAVGG